MVGVFSLFFPCSIIFVNYHAITYSQFFTSCSSTQVNCTSTTFAVFSIVYHINLLIEELIIKSLVYVNVSSREIRLNIILFILLCLFFTWPKFFSVCVVRLWVLLLLVDHLIFLLLWIHSGVN